MLTPELESRLERWPAVLQLSCAWTLGIITVTLMPLEISALMARLGWAEGAASGVAGSQLLGIVLACLVMPRWITRLPQTLLICALLGLVAAQWASALATAPAVLIGLRMAVGFIEGLGIVLAGACLAHHPMHSCCGAR